MLLSTSEWTDSAKSEEAPVIENAISLLIAILTLAASEANIAPLLSCVDIYVVYDKI